MGCQLLLHTDSILVAYTNYWISIWLINVEILLFERFPDITCVILSLYLAELFSIYFCKEKHKIP